MDEIQILDKLKQLTAEAGLESVVQTKEDFFQNRLLIYSGHDHLNREQLLEVTVQNVSLHQEAFSEQNQDYSGIRLQIDSSFPFLVTDLAMPEVAQFLHFLNLQIEVPGFFLNYIDNRILYRYVLLSSENHIPFHIILSVLGMIMFLQDAFGSALEKISREESTFLKILEDIQHILATAFPNPKK